MRDYDTGIVPHAARLVDEPSSNAALPYLVSDAIPLHALGLVPPPPEIGPHLLSASPIEVALAAALATADELAIVEPPAEPDAPSEILDDDEWSTIEAEAAEMESSPPTPSLDPIGGLVEDTRANVPLLTAAFGSKTAGDAPDLPIAAEATEISPHSNLAVVGASTEPEATAMPKAAPPKSEALASLDLSRRTEPAAGTVPPALPPKTTLTAMAPELPRVVAQSAAAAQSRAASAAACAPSRPTYFEVASWPGFLTGLAVALVIGAGIYVSLVAG